MIQFNMPENLNGKELVEELEAAGVSVVPDEKNIKAPVIKGDGTFWLDISSEDEVKATPIIAAHNGTTIAPDNSAAKAALLERLGITEEEARLLLS
jgi:hypothetical protein